MIAVRLAFDTAHINFESASSLLHFSNTLSSVHVDVHHGGGLCVSEGSPSVHVCCKLMRIHNILTNLL